MLAAFLFLGILFLGCTGLSSPSSQCKDCSKTEMELYKANVDYGSVSEKLQEKTAALSACDGARTACENARSRLNSDCEASSGNLSAGLAACNNEKSACGTILASLNSSLNGCLGSQSNMSSLASQLVSCNSDKGSCNSALAACNTEKETCGTSLAAAQALAWSPKTLVKHYVRGNLAISGAYVTTEVSLYPAENASISDVKTVTVGLDYTGGNDSFFAPAVTASYGLNLVRWYVLATSDGGQTFTSSGDDTVKIENGVFKVKNAEFDASTSKESLKLRRIIVIYAYK